MLITLVVEEGTHASRDAAGAGQVAAGAARCSADLGVLRDGDAGRDCSGGPALPKVFRVQTSESERQRRHQCRHNAVTEELFSHRN